MLDQTNDVFEYFKGALLDDDESIGKNPEKWPYYYDFNLMDERFTVSNSLTLPSLPFSRQVFYDWIDYWTDARDYYESPMQEGVVNMFHTIVGEKLYTFGSPVSGWPVRAVNDWGKIKSLELGLFGNVANGGSLSSQTIVGSGTLRSRIPHMKHSNPDYLRFALIKFDSYGPCHPVNASSPAPTNPVTNTSARTFDWTFASGYTSLSNYEYSINGGTWTTPTTKPINIPTFSHIPSGGLSLRTKGGGYVSPSSEIRNSSTYIGPFIIYIWIVRESSIDYTIRVQTEKGTASSAINFSGNLVLNRATGGSSTVAYSINLPAGNINAIQPREASFALASDGHFINTCTTSPSSTTSGRPIQVFMNFVPIS